SGDERSALRMAVHVREQLGECLRRDEVARRETGAVLERERRRVDVHRVDQEAALDVESRFPRAFTLELAAQQLEQHLREPIMARVEDGEDDVRERPAPEVCERGGATAQRAVRERVGSTRGAPLYRDSLAGERGGKGRGRGQVRVGG